MEVGQKIRTIVELDGVAIGSVGVITHVYGPGFPGMQPTYEVVIGHFIETVFVQENQIELIDTLKDKLNKIQELQENIKQIESTLIMAHISDTDWNEDIRQYAYSPFYGDNNILLPLPEGMLHYRSDKKIISPDSGSDYFVVVCEDKNVLKDFIKKNGFSAYAWQGQKHIKLD